MDLSHHFLVSMPQMLDTCFRNSVVYILDHGEQGAFGVIINHVMQIDFASVLAQVEIAVDSDSVANFVSEIPVHNGGPVNENHGMVLHHPGIDFQSTHNFVQGVSLSSSRDVLEAIACGEVPSSALVVLGHSGWASGQLEMEIANNAWLSCPADSTILFDTPLHERRTAVANLLGIDLSNVVGQAGHA